jgi:hypothetical protein
MAPRYSDAPYSFLPVDIRAVALKTLAIGTKPDDSPFVPLMYEPLALILEMDGPIPPAYLEAHSFKVSYIVDRVFENVDQIAAGHLGAVRARSEQSRSRVDHVLVGHHMVRVDGTFLCRDSEGNSHKHELWIQRFPFRL